MVHPRVEQLRFTRGELVRAMKGVSEEDARRRVLPMNALSWIVGHLASQEHHYWVVRGQGRNLLPDLDGLVGHGAPASTPPLDEMWAAWHTVTEAADPYLDTLTTASLQDVMAPYPESIGNMLQRTTYHYWYHIGESQAIRQLLGHADLPQFVGDIRGGGPYRPEEHA
jgi:hypothetical protein